MPAGIHTVDLAHSSLVIHRVRMPFGIPRRPAPTIGVVRISTKTLHTQVGMPPLVSLQTNFEKV